MHPSGVLMQKLCKSVARAWDKRSPQSGSKEVYFLAPRRCACVTTGGYSHSSDASAAPRSDPFWRLWRSSSSGSKNMSDDLVICFRGSASAVIMKAHFFFIFFIINL